MKLARAILLTMTTSIAAHGAVTKASFGKLPDGTAVDKYTLKSPSVEVGLITYGARIVSIKTADKAGKVADVALGYNDIEGYVTDNKTYVGSVVGRYGNRIAFGKFSLDGKAYTIPTNNNANTLHGGTVGFDKKVWDAKEIPGGVEFTHVSPDGDMGYPGTLTAHVKYTLHGDALHIDYSATTTKDTVLNLTNHAYFNLSGEGSGLILGEHIMIDADHYTPVDSGLIPTGELAPVEGTPFDLRKPTLIGAADPNANPQTKLGGGYDHNWVLNGKIGVLHLAAKVHDPATGRILTVTTTEPGVQFYAGTSIPGTFAGKSGVTYLKNAGFCLETQHFPDSPNHPKFPSTELKVGQTMHSTTVFTFTVDK
jgi:aldose 1-epimerase